MSAAIGNLFKRPSGLLAAWVDSFIRHIAANHIPADFVSTHVYANDSAKDVFNTDENLSRTQMVCRAEQKMRLTVGNGQPRLVQLASVFAETRGLLLVTQRLAPFVTMGHAHVLFAMF